MIRSIRVHPAGDMTVTETIRVVGEGDQIRHGIYRDFPTRYKDRYNNTVSVGFEVQAGPERRPARALVDGGHGQRRPGLCGQQGCAHRARRTYLCLDLPHRPAAGFLSRSTTNCTGTSPATAGSSRSSRPAPRSNFRPGPRFAPPRPLPALSGDKGKDFTATVDSRWPRRVPYDLPLLTQAGSDHRGHLAQGLRRRNRRQGREGRRLPCR